MAFPAALWRSAHRPGLSIGFGDRADGLKFFGHRPIGHRPISRPKVGQKSPQSPPQVGQKSAPSRPKVRKSQLEVKPKSAQSGEATMTDLCQGSTNAENDDDDGTALEVPTC